MARRLGFAAVVVALVCSLGSSLAGAASAGVEARSGSTLQADVNRIRDIGTAGVLAEVLSARRVERARAGVAELGKPDPVDWDSHFRIGSTTKTMVSTVILQLVGEGRLTLEDNLERWLPGLVQGNGNHGEHITVRQVLQHTSGLPDYLNNPVMTEKIVTPAGFYAHRYDDHTLGQLLAYAMELPPTFGPGARWNYSNTNYIVAGMIIEAVTGGTWANEIRARIITPLGLTETTEPGSDPTLPAPFARGYEYYDESSRYPWDTTEHNMTWGASAGSLISTPHDVNTFLRALMSGRLLRPAQLAAMLTTVPLPAADQAYWPGGAYGLGIFRTDLPCGGVYWHHGGDVIGYSDTNGVLPNGSKSAVVASTTNTFIDPVFADSAIRTNNQLVWNALCGGVSAPAQLPVDTSRGGRPLTRTMALAG